MKKIPKQTCGPALAAAVILIFTGCGPQAGTGTRFETAAVQVGDIEQHVTASGTLGAEVSVDVGSQVSGRISRLSVDFNSPVTRGQLIAEIDPTVYEASLRQAEGELASAQANVVLKRQNLERRRVLLPQRAASQLDLDQATAELAQAEASVVIRDALLASARANLGYCKITSPVDGVVIARKVDVGQTVIAAMSTPVLFTIASDIARMNISAAISEADIGGVREGQDVTFGVDAFPEEAFRGRVSQVRRSPTTTQNVVTYETIISVANPDRRLFPGMTADVSILVERREGVPKIPNTALRYSPPEGVSFEHSPPRTYGRSQRLVYLRGKDPATLRPLLLRAGITDGVDTEIREGLAKGDLVVTSTLSGKSGTPSLIPKAPPQPPE